jgi:hypothetical protein
VKPGRRREAPTRTKFYPPFGATTLAGPRRARSTHENEILPSRHVVEPAWHAWAVASPRQSHGPPAELAPRRLNAQAAVRVCPTDLGRKADRRRRWRSDGVGNDELRRPADKASVGVRGRGAVRSLGPTTHERRARAAPSSGQPATSSRSAPSATESAARFLCCLLSTIQRGSLTIRRETNRSMAIPQSNATGPEIRPGATVSPNLCWIGNQVHIARQTTAEAAMTDHAVGGIERLNNTFRPREVALDFWGFWAFLA